MFLLRRDSQDVSDHRLFGTIGGKKVSTKEKRWYKDVGLGFKTPPEAINGTYIGVYAFSTSFEYSINVQ
jgi:hypothetical protein